MIESSFRRTPGSCTEKNPKSLRFPEGFSFNPMNNQPPAGECEFRTMVNAKIEPS